MRDKLFKNHPFPIPNLANDERLLLASAHENLLALNKECIDAVMKKGLSTSIGHALDPYGDENYISMDHAARVKLFSEGDIRLTKDAYLLNPAIDAAKDALIALKRSEPPFDVKQWTEFTKVLEEQLLRVGPMDNPDIVEEATNAGRQNEGFKQWLRLSVSCLSLKASLTSLDQLVFQAIKQDKLALLNEENIIEIRGGGFNLVTRNHQIVYQLSPQAGFIEPKEVVLIKCSVNGMNINSLCKTGSTKISMSADLGNYMEAEFWELDDFLNPYGNLFNVVQRLN